MKSLKNLDRKQKEAIGLLQIGTFLEYFDLMLYVHMAVLLNELFFPNTDPHTASLLAAFAFCSTYVLRPFGALIFGYIGDNIGRKSTVIVTTMMMSLSCILMANLPTYAQIGITASWLVTLCRMVQGLSSMGEIMGAMIYITEIVKRPLQFAMVSLVALSASLGAAFALAISSLVTSCGLEWRLAFWIGAGIAVIGSVARTQLRETPEFLAHKKKKETFRKGIPVDQSPSQPEGKVFYNLVAYFATECSYAFTFYLIFIYFNPSLKALGYQSSDIIVHNFYLSLIAILYNMVMVFLSTRYNPLKIVRFRANYGLMVIILLPVLLVKDYSIGHVFCVQVLLLLYRGGATPADSIFIQRFKVDKRFTFVTFNYALSRACMHVTSAFGLVYLTEWFGHYGILLIGLPIAIAFIWGARHFERLENPIKDKTINLDVSAEKRDVSSLKTKSR